MLGGAYESFDGRHALDLQLVSLQLSSFRTPHAGIEWLETNSETNWVRKYATMGEQTCWV
jgi:hypothetical protein